MKNFSFLCVSALTRREKAVALITVLALISMLTIFCLALLSVGTMEKKAAVVNSDGEMARQYADSAVNVVMGQIWQATRQDTASAGRELWSSQPGAIRKYRADGGFHSGYKLYSSSQMRVSSGEQQMIDDAPANNWAASTSRYANLNEPIVKPATLGSRGGVRLYFPIVDPRAYVRDLAGQDGSPNIEGFWYDGNFEGVKSATSTTDEGARLPMPVEWLYVLKNGDMGTLSAAGVFQGAPGAGAPSESNPIVARIAFWTDDETSKININTASEPTYWALPTFFHRRDQYWAHYQPTTFEYQRYPGHPATVAMSSVLFPNQPMDTYAYFYRPGAGAATLSSIVDRKERIYSVAPKINGGGSKAGTLPYWRFVDMDYNGDGIIDNSNNNLTNVNMTDALKERLYASVDEFFFSQRVSQNERETQDQGQTVRVFENDNDIERMRFFLTAHSRMPELTMFGTPRVAMWPISARGPDYRTGFDKLIAFCSTLGPARSEGASGNTYFFQRLDPTSSTVDINIARNAQLISYLGSLMGKTYPGGASFRQKYLEDADQILIEIFDYIRSTNLYDPFLAPPRSEVINSQGKYATEKIPNRNDEGHKDGNYYRMRPELGQFKTYTHDRLSRGYSRETPLEKKSGRLADKSFPGHGQVVPSESKDGAFRGFGRFITLTEFGFHFICSADGNKDKGSYRIRNTDGTVPDWPGETAAQADPKISGGRTALRIKPEQYGQGGGLGTAQAELVNWINGNRVVTTDQRRGQYDVWYSNYPPFPPAGSYGTTPATQGNHPGFDARNWNISLPDGRPLRQGEKRVQAMLQMEFTTPSAGYTKLHPDFTVVVEGTDNCKIDGNRIFDTGNSGRLIWRSGFETMENDQCRSIGGSFNSITMAANRRVKAPSPRMPADPQYDTSALSSGDVHRGTRNMDLVSRFFTVTGDEMTFTGDKITVKIYAGHDINRLDRLVQTINLPLPSSLPLPVPHLVTLTSDNERWQGDDGNFDNSKIIDAPSWWSFNWGGVLGRFTRSGGTITATNSGADLSNAGAWGGRTLGRFASWANIATDRLSRSNVPRGEAAIFGYDSANGNFSSGLLNPIQPAPDSDRDAFSNTGLVDMNPNATGPRRGVTAGKRVSPDNRGTDVVFTIVPRHGDFRLLMAKKEVPESDWVIHPRADNLLRENGQFFAHNLTRFDSNVEVAYYQDPSPNLRIVPNANYHASKRVDVSSDGQFVEAVNLAKRYGDFDNGPGTLRDGPWINKPDEGNTPVSWLESWNNEVRRTPSAYLNERWWLNGGGEDAGDAYMTPNRMVSSPGMFGSLPTGVKRNDPWKTLLFRPHTARDGASVAHPGGPSSAGGVDPADHYLMDLFWMPVVEPYAISEPFSTAGKVNLNYQMVPFQNYIRRATGIHAVMKGELLSGVPVLDAGRYKNAPDSSGTVREEYPGQPDAYRTVGAYRDYTDNAPGDRDYTSKGFRPKIWHRYIDVESRVNEASKNVQGTLQQFEDRFNHTSASRQTHGLFRTASQICEVHLIPKKVAAPVNDGGDAVPNGSYTHNQMSSFWSYGTGNPRSVTGDNTRERPYANLYGKITTQSNTFKVFIHTQVIRKARSTRADQFDPSKDSITGEYRGSALIERRIEHDDARLPNYAANPDATPLDAYYRFRVLEMKRFNP